MASKNEYQTINMPMDHTGMGSAGAFNADSLSMKRPSIMGAVLIVGALVATALVSNYYTRSTMMMQEAERSLMSRAAYAPPASYPSSPVHGGAPQLARARSGLPMLSTRARGMLVDLCDEIERSFKGACWHNRAVSETDLCKLCSAMY